MNLTSRISSQFQISTHLTSWLPFSRASILGLCVTHEAAEATTFILGWFWYYGSRRVCECTRCSITKLTISAIIIRNFDQVMYRSRIRFEINSDTLARNWDAWEQIGWIPMKGKVLKHCEKIMSTRFTSFESTLSFRKGLKYFELGR